MNETRAATTIPYRERKFHQPPKDTRGTIKIFNHNEKHIRITCGM